MLILEIFIATILLWIFFIATATLKNKLFHNKLSWPIKVPMLLFGLLFLICDVIYNFTYGAIVFAEFASWKRKTLTARLKHILHSGEYMNTEWRFKLAWFMCKYMIEPWDVGHCSLEKL